MKKVLRFLVPVVALACIVLIDQLTKNLIVSHLYEGEEVKILGDALVLTYVQNRGMAWGMFQNGQILFSILTPLAIGFITFLYLRTPWEPEYRPIRIAEVMLVGGAIGNLIDRIFRFEEGTGSLFHGYVVDMIYVKAIKFPVFNVADIFVTLAFVLILLLLLFVYDEDEFNRCFNLPGTKIEPKKEESEEGESEEKEEEKKEETENEKKDTETEETVEADAEGEKAETEVTEAEEASEEEKEDSAE